MKAEKATYRQTMNPRVHLEGAYVLEDVELGDKVVITAKAELVSASVKDYDGKKRVEQTFALSDIEMGPKKSKDNDLKARIMRGGSGGVTR